MEQPPPAFSQNWTTKYYNSTKPRSSHPRHLAKLDHQKYHNSKQPWSSHPGHLAKIGPTKYPITRQPWSNHPWHLAKLDLQNFTILDSSEKQPLAFSQIWVTKISHGDMGMRCISDCATTVSDKCANRHPCLSSHCNITIERKLDGGQAHYPLNDRFPNRLTRFGSWPAELVDIYLGLHRGGPL